MKKWLAGLMVAGALLLPTEAGAEESLLSEALLLHQNAHAVIILAGKAMEQPFLTSFDPQRCLEKAKELHSFLEKNEAMIPAALSEVLGKEEALLKMAVDYFKTLGTVRPSLNALVLSQKQYNATKIKEAFAAALVTLEERTRVL